MRLDQLQAVTYAAGPDARCPAIMPAVRGRVVDGGRIIVPAEFRRQMGIAKGDIVLFEMHGDELRVHPVRSALRRLQAKLKSYAGTGQLVADELIAERRAEAERE